MTINDQDIANDEDTEGHMPFRRSALPDTDKSVGADDTEDHGLPSFTRSGR